jgi:glycolate oxidase iron-sulfur subunit
MQHQISLEKLGPPGEAMTHAIEACVHCGFCLPTCPTYQVLGEEMDSPRGRIILMKEVLEGALSLEESMPYLDRCLGCLACVTACPSGVAYGELITPFRAYAEAGRSRQSLDKVSRFLIHETLPYPQRFRLAATLGKFARPIQGLLPRDSRALRGIGTMLELLPESLPSAAPLPMHYPAQGTRRAKVALLAGCAQQVLAPQINWATLRVLARNGVEVVIPTGQNCCGALAMHAGEDEQARALARHNFQSFPGDVDAIISNAAGCGSGMKEYGLLFKGMAEEEIAHTFARKVKDVSVFLTELGLEPPPPLPQPLKLAYHDACHLAHAQGVRAEPRQLLTSIPNLTLLEIADGDICCGSAGTYNLEHPEIAHQLGERKVNSILNAGAEAVATGNIGCLAQIRAHLADQEQPLSVYHTIEVLDWAYTPP